MLASLRTTPAFFLRPVEILRSYRHESLVPDLLAGLTVGVVLLPQAIVFSFLAGLPPEMGIYSAIVASVIGALWGSSNHLNTGPTNTASALVLSTLLPLATPGTAVYMAAAGLLAVMAGLFRVVMGVARLGLLVNFVSDSVVIGFTGGVGVLIIASQLSSLLRITTPGAPDLPGTIAGLLPQLGGAHLPSLLLGIGSAALILLLRRLAPKLPASLIGIVVAAFAVWALGLQEQGVAVLGELPRSLPPLADLTILDLDLIGQLSNGALAIAAIGLVEAASIARSIASNSGQRLDSNQEFVGQGLANIAAGIFSGYPCSGSFNRSAVLYRAGGQTALAGVAAGLFVLLAMFMLAPFAAYVPRATLAAELILTAYAMIDRRRIVRIWRGARGDAAILLVTLLATLLLPLQFAVLAGVLMSLAYYILQTSAPQVLPVLPDASFRHWLHQPEKPQCPQLAVVDVLGDLYFGAVSHVEEAIRHNLDRNPDQRFLLLRMHSVQRMDISGIRALESIVRLFRGRGGDVYMLRVRQPVFELMQATGFVEHLGADHFLPEDSAIDFIFHKVLDPAICIYECEVRAFKECQNLPKRAFPLEIPLWDTAQVRRIPEVEPRDLWQALREESPPRVVDVREPREFEQGHIPGARLVPLPAFLNAESPLPADGAVVLVCRSGRRSARAAGALLRAGYDDVRIVSGGMLAWENAGLLVATGKAVGTLSVER